MEKMTQSRPFAVVLLSLLVLAAYYNSLFTPFMWDDRTLVLENAGIKQGLKSALDALSPTLWGLRTDNEAFQSFYRPLHTLLSILDYQVWGFNHFGFHLTNTLFHLFNTWLLYFFAVRLTGDRAAALIGASIFAVHPVHTEAVTFISARPDLLSAFFLLLSFHLYMSSEGAYGARYAASLASFALAMLSKEMAVTLPLLLAAYSLLMEREGGRLKRLLPYFAVLLAYALFRVFSTDVFLQSHRMRADLVTLALTASVAVLDYARLLVLPYPLKAFYEVVWHKASDPKTLLALALLASAAAASIWLAIRGRAKAAFCLIWTFVAMAPVLNIGSLGEFSIAERYLYTPSIGFSILAGMALAAPLSGGRAKAALPVAIGALVVALTVMTINRNRVWADDVTFFTDMAEGAPGAPLPRANLAAAYLRAGEPAKAVAPMEAAVRLAPGNARLLYDLGFLYNRVERFDDALRALGEAVDIDPRFGGAYNLIGVAYAGLGDLAAAERAFETASRLMSDPAAPVRNLERLRALRKGLAVP